MAFNKLHQTTCLGALNHLEYLLFIYLFNNISLIRHCSHC